MMTAPRIYVACLRAYNAGKLHGAWIDLQDASEDDIDKAIENIIESSPEADAEEWAVHDHEGLCGYKPGHDIAQLVDVVELIDAHGRVFAAALSLRDDVEDVRDFINERYLGEYRNLDDWAEEYLECNRAISRLGDLRIYFDYAAYARDCDMNGDISAVHDPEMDCYYVFSN